LLLCVDHRIFSSISLGAPIINQPGHVTPMRTFLLLALFASAAVAEVYFQEKFDGKHVALARSGFLS
jgi:hypothetical protein